MSIDQLTRDLPKVQDMEDFPRREYSGPQFLMDINPVADLGQKTIDGIAKDKSELRFNFDIATFFAFETLTGKRLTYPKEYFDEVLNIHNNRQKVLLRNSPIGFEGVNYLTVLMSVKLHSLSDFAKFSIDPEAMKNARAELDRTDEIRFLRGAIAYNFLSNEKLPADYLKKKWNQMDKKSLKDYMTYKNRLHYDEYNPNQKYWIWEGPGIDLFYLKALYPNAINELSLWNPEFADQVETDFLKSKLDKRWKDYFEVALGASAAQSTRIELTDKGVVFHHGEEQKPTPPTVIPPPIERSVG